MKTRSNLFAIAAGIGLALWLLPAPSIAADDAAMAEGERVYRSIAGIGCKTCHGEFAEGDLGVGPYIRGATEGTIRAAIDGINEMVVVRNVIGEDEIKAVAAYLGELGTLQVVRTLAKRGRFLPDAVSVRPGTRVQLVIQNAGLDAHTFRSDDMGIADLTIAGRSAGSGRWLAPDAEGEYSLYCTDCKLKDQLLTLRIDSTAPEFRPVAAPKAAAAGDPM